MYHIKTDKRTGASVAKICDGLGACMREKSFSKISVAEIADAAGVSRATFYRSFDTPHDILVYLCDKLVGELVLSLPLADSSDRNQLLLRTLEYLTDHADEITVVFNAGRTDLLQKALEPYAHQLVQPAAKQLSARELDYFRISAITRLLGIFHVWNFHGRVESPSEIMRILKQIDSN